MRKYYSVLAVAALMIAGCTTEKEFVPVANGESTITAIRDASASRTVVHEDGKTLWWSAGETIDVFYGAGGSASVFKGQNEAPAPTAVFAGDIEISEGNDINVYAIIPPMKPTQSTPAAS